MNLPKTYEPKLYEDEIYAMWEKTGVFTPKKDKAANSFSMTLPPPNANASLHMGQALDFQLKDVIARWQRLQGKQVLMLPGADHAGFETWYVYERKLNEQGKSKFDFSREELYKQVWDFVEENRGTQESQVRRLGVGADWTRYTYTLDSHIVDRAYDTFKKMWQDGLIYRGERLVNYCTYHNTSFSDIEVEHVERTTPLYYMQYGPFTLATTRPETKFGDTAVAVHPDDKRYKKYVGAEIEVDGLNGPFKLQVVADEHVDPEFGTGAVKITPAHDFNDWDIAERHDLPAVTVINEDGTMNEKAGKYAGLTVAEARKAVVKDLKAKDMLVKVDEEYQNKVGTCYKCGTTIEPLLMKQWFVSMKPLAESAIKRLENKEITFFPSKKRLEAIDYMGQIKDWNISRQIAWGIPIPVFQNVEDEDDWIFDTNVAEETIEKDGKTYRRDPDVFDTWWSSGQWPYSTLRFPDHADTKQFFPTSLMETGSDLLRQWVCRMIMLSGYVTGEVPFKQVYLHGMVLDDKGQKMSKSKGNVVNPMEPLEEYGADALRIGLINGITAGNAQPYVIPKVIGGRNFCNKLWNIARFSIDIFGDTAAKADLQTDADHWILSKLAETREVSTKAMQTHRVSEAYNATYGFIWNDLADWYIEASKQKPNKALLRYILEESLKLAHSFAPFVTEAIWQVINPDSTLAEQVFINTPKFDTNQAGYFEQTKAVIAECRHIISTLKASHVTLYHKGSDHLIANADTITQMTKLLAVTEVEEGKGLHLTTVNDEAWLDIDSQTASTYAVKLEDEIAALEKVVSGLEGRLKNKAYVKNAPKEIVEQTKQSLEENQQLIAKKQAEVARFKPTA